MYSAVDILQEWRAAQHAADTLERAALRMALRAVDPAEPADLKEARAQAQRARETADDLYALAMDEMKKRADAAKG